MANEFIALIAEDLDLGIRQVGATLRLLDDGATIPFIARYRKEAPGALDEGAVHNIASRYEVYKNLARRKETVISTIKEQGKLTPELKARIDETRDPAILEDIYLPYKPKRRTRAQIAIEKGLQPLAAQIMSQTLDNPLRAARKYIKNGEVDNVESALEGAKDIIAEWVSESEKARGIVRSRYQRNAVITSNVVSGKEKEGANYENYFDFSSPLRLCTSYRLLAILRGQNEGFLKVSVSIDDKEMTERLVRMFIKSNATAACAEIIRAAVRDSYRRLIRPSIETEVLGVAKSKADESAIAMFTENARQLLLAPPLGHKRVLAIDPGFRNGCKIVCLDNQGNLLCNDIIYPHPPANDCHGAAFKLMSLVDRYRIEAIAIGNGTASRETEKFVNSLRFDKKISVYIVNESGASIYSASEIARAEFPDKDVTVRGAVSIGRRLIDPLAELVKIDPKSIGVGQYQHDVDQTRLRDAMSYTVMSCVNSVGVNVNTASPELLSYVSGIGRALAGYIVDYRREHGPFRRRSELMNVPRMGEKAYQQSAGFLRITDGDYILDNTAVHPERYELVERIADDNGIALQRLVASPALLHNLDLTPYITKDTGLPTLTDIILELEKPGRDPRGMQEEDTAFDDRIKDISDLRPGMEVSGIVNNITSFGCFVDIGLHENGLIHISQMSDNFVSNPGDIVYINQKITARVLDVDPQRGRIALTLKGVQQQ
ncbi:MAG: RNA-binding transcriptional accessory protein [Muribaculum sp.]|nr:RNA-binding transcriptional accessory protein [Muribaculum sp.]